MKKLSGSSYVSFRYALKLLVVNLCVASDVDVLSGVVRSQAGVVLERLDAHLAEHGLMAPLDLGAKGRPLVTNSALLAAISYDFVSFPLNIFFFRFT